MAFAPGILILLGCGDFKHHPAPGEKKETPGIRTKCMFYRGRFKNSATVKIHECSQVVSFSCVFLACFHRLLFTCQCLRIKFYLFIFHANASMFSPFFWTISSTDSRIDILISASMSFTLTFELFKSFIAI